MATDANRVTVFLAHHGVKGMKWGVRRDRGHEGERAKTKVIAKADKKYEKQFTGTRGWVNVQNAFAQHINPMLDVMNNKPQYKDKDLTAPENKALWNRYLKDYEKVFDQAAKATGEHFGTNASGTLAITVRREGTGEDSQWVASFHDPSAAKHADAPPQEGDLYTIIPTFDKTGHIVAVRIEPYAGVVVHADVNDFLAHFGVKGMKWGVRRDHSAAVGRIQKDLPKAALAKTNPTNKSYAIKTKQAGGLHKVSDADLRKMIERMDMEKRYTQMMNADRERRLKGLQAIGRILGEVGKIALPVVLTAAAGAAAGRAASGVYRTTATTSRVIEGTTRAIGA